MAENADLIEKIAQGIERGNEVEFDHIVEIHRRIKSLRQSLNGQIKDREEAALIAAEADLLLEKIILEYVANTPDSLRNLKRILATLYKAAKGLESQFSVGAVRNIS
jgi:hypothetical protein